MKAVVINRYGASDVLEIVERPRPVAQSGQVIIKTVSAAVNPKDIFIRKGRFKILTRRSFPLAMGSDFAGEVVEIGAGVSDLKIGDPVYGMIDGWHGGAYAEYIAINSNNVGLIPPTLSFDGAAALPIAALTALQSLRDLGRIDKSSHVCINGASGGVGTMAVQIAHCMKARITAICSHRNIEFVSDLGADEIWDYTALDVLSQKASFDLFFDVFGNMSFARVRHLLKPDGIYVSTVPKVRNFIAAITSRLIYKQRANVVVVRPRRSDLDALSEMVANGELRPILDSVYALEDVKAAQEKVQTKRTRGKVILQIEKGRGHEIPRPSV